MLQDNENIINISSGCTLRSFVSVEKIIISSSSLQIHICILIEVLSVDKIIISSSSLQTHICILIEVLVY